MTHAECNDDWIVEKCIQVFANAWIFFWFSFTCLQVQLSL